MYTMGCHTGLYCSSAGMQYTSTYYTCNTYKDIIHAIQIHPHTHTHSTADVDVLRQIKERVCYVADDYARELKVCCVMRVWVCVFLHVHTSSTSSINLINHPHHVIFINPPYQ